MKRVPDPIGQRFGKLMVIARVGTSPGGAVMLQCRCDCGSPPCIVRKQMLLRGDTQSCGCARRALDGQRTREARETFDSRFWARVDRTAGPGGCWPWIGGVDDKGYGVVRRPGDARQVIASRAAYELMHGAIPAGLIVRHQCDNPPCVNPAHLALGTHKDNSDDKLSRGRGKWAKGEEVGSARLTAEQAAAIRASPLPLRQLAAQYGMTYGHIGKIKRGELWAD